MKIAHERRHVTRFASAAAGLGLGVAGEQLLPAEKGSGWETARSEQWWTTGRWRGREHGKLVCMSSAEVTETAGARGGDGDRGVSCINPLLKKFDNTFYFTIS